MDTANARRHVVRIKEDVEAARSAVTAHRYDEASAHALTAIAGAIAVAIDDIVEEEAQGEL